MKGCTEVNTNDSSTEAFEAYERDPSLLEPGQGVKRLPSKPGRLGGAVPVRFAEPTLAAVKLFADEDGVTVSRWIRDAVDDSIDRRRSASRSGRETANVNFVVPGARMSQSHGAVERAVRKQRVLARNG